MLENHTVLKSILFWLSFLGTAKLMQHELTITSYGKDGDPKVEEVPAAIEVGLPPDENFQSGFYYVDDGEERVEDVLCKLPLITLQNEGHTR